MVFLSDSYLNWCETLYSVELLILFVILQMFAVL